MSARPPPEVQQIDLTKLNLQQLQQIKNEFESVFVNMTNQKYIFFKHSFIIYTHTLNLNGIESTDQKKKTT